ncbi:hypothetical protein YC2023_029874 [Brassica napus]
MDLKPPYEIEAPTANVTKVTPPINVSSCSSPAFTSAIEASIQPAEASSVNPAPCDDEFSETPPATTIQSTAGNLPPVDSSITHESIAVVEESLPLVISEIAKAHTLDEESERDTALLLKRIALLFSAIHLRMPNLL